MCLISLSIIYKQIHHLLYFLVLLPNLSYYITLTSSSFSLLESFFKFSNIKSISSYFKIDYGADSSTS